MSVSTTMTIRIPNEVKEKLERLAANTRRSKSFLAGEAVAAYVDHEISIIEGVNRGVSDVNNGNVVTHEEAMAELYAAIDCAAAKHS